jgi:hypothetical protein
MRANRRGFTEKRSATWPRRWALGGKYADLAQNRQSIRLQLGSHVAMECNTAPYMMYAYARIRSIYRKGASRRKHC